MGGGFQYFPTKFYGTPYPSWLFMACAQPQCAINPPSWWDSKLKITWARDIVRPVVPCRPTRGRFGPPDRNLVGVIKCAFQSAMCGGDRVVRVPPASSVNVRCQFGKGGVTALVRVPPPLLQSMFGNVLVWGSTACTRPPACSYRNLFMKPPWPYCIGFWMVVDRVYASPRSQLPNTFYKIWAESSTSS